jgi:hypothetical protein
MQQGRFNNIIGEAQISLRVSRTSSVNGAQITGEDRRVECQLI